MGYPPHSCVVGCTAFIVARRFIGDHIPGRAGHVHQPDNQPAYYIPPALSSLLLASSQGDFAQHLYWLNSRTSALRLVLVRRFDRHEPHDTTTSVRLVTVDASSPPLGFDDH